MFDDSQFRRREQFSERSAGIQVDVDGVSAILKPELEIASPPQNVPEDKIGEQGIDMNVEPPTRPKYPEDFLDDSAWFVTVMQHAMGINVVKRSVREREVSSVRPQHSGKVADAGACQFKMFGRNIHAGCMGSVARKLQEVTPSAATDFQYPFTAMVAELSSFVEPWKNPITLLFRDVQRGRIPVLDRQIRC